MRTKSYILFVMVFLIIQIPTPALTSNTIRIAGIFAKTGRASRTNIRLFEGLRAFIKDANTKGGVLGKQIDLLEFDNHSTPLGSELAAKKAVKNGVVAVIGASWSSHSLAAAPVLQKAGIPMISPTSTSPDLTKIGNCIFRICFTDDFQGRLLANFARNELKADTATVFTNLSSQYSKSLSQLFIEQFQSTGGNILQTKDYIDKTTDFSKLFIPMQNKRPDIFFLPDHNTKSSLILAQLFKMGFKIPFLGGDALGMELSAKIEKLGIKFENHFNGYCLQPWDKSTTTPETRAFVERFETELNLRQTDERALVYDALSVLIHAINKAGDIKPDLIRTALSKTKDFKGVTGDITFDSIGNPNKSGVIMKIESGQLKFIKVVKP